MQTDRKDKILCGEHARAIEAKKTKLKNKTLQEVIEFIRENSDSFNSGVLIAGLERKYLSEDIVTTVSHNLSI